MLAGARIVVRLAFVVQLALGITLWTGRLYQLRSLHIAIGIVFVLGLWTVAGLALGAGVRVPTASVLIVTGLVVIAFGLLQEGLLPGSAHWVVDVVHLLLGVTGIALAEAVGGAAARAARSAVP